MMDVRNVRDIEPELEHNGTVPVWWLIRPREMKDLTDEGRGTDRLHDALSELSAPDSDRVMQR
jgi:hypothetical protein